MATQTGASERLLIGGSWVEGRGATRDVLNKYDGTRLGSVPLATPQEIEQALEAAHQAFPRMAALPAHQRAAILNRTADLIAADREQLGRTIAAEAGKALRFALAEADRAVQTFRFAAEEAKRIHGETVPMDAAVGSEGKLGFYLRVPRGPVVAISPFNFPLNLVAHKVAPAIAAGNSLILKPPTATPLTALHLGHLLLEAGMPPGGVNIITGEGATVGDALVSDPRVAVVSFTGSPPVGKHILAKAGLKRVILELGSNSGVIVAADADFGRIFPNILYGAFSNTGQICISVQRLFVHESRFEEFARTMVESTERLVVGDPLDPATEVGPMISEAEAQRAEEWIADALAEGARLLTGGERDGVMLAPTILTDVRPEMKVVCREVFAPLVSLIPFGELDEAIRMVNDSRFGLQAGIYTESLRTAMEAARRLEVGGVMINDHSNYRADHMPYGGVKESGLGREGVGFTVDEMTELRMVVINA